MVTAGSSIPKPLSNEFHLLRREKETAIGSGLHYDIMDTLDGGENPYNLFQVGQ
jgi:hypothetical protein